ncbi:protease inhibitor I42 family protein [Chloroflexota bacterium]
MKKLLIVVAIVLIASLAGCVFRVVETYTDEGQSIDIGVDREFALVLGSNPTTGFNWQLTHDSTMLELVEKKYVPGKKAEAGVVGAGGANYFRFRTLRTGETVVTLVYRQLWEGGKTSDTKTFTINIK